jgi:HK97 family phage portal protein
MGLLDRVFRENDVRPLYLNDPALKEYFGGYHSVTGAHVTPENSLHISGWYAGVQILAGAVSSLPCIVYERLERGRRRADNHSNYRLLHDQPNPWMTSLEFFENAQAALIMWGNSFSLIERNGAGKVTALWPMPPNRVRMQVVNQRIWYYYHPLEGGEIQLRMEDVLHVRGLARHQDYSVWGYSPVDLAREQLGLAKAEEEYRARFFKNDAMPGAIVEYPNKISDAAYKRFKEDWQETYGGLGNKFKIGFLEQGLKLSQIGFPPEAAEFIEGRKFQLEEIARILRIPLVLLQSTEKATSWGTGIEQFMLGFVQFTVREWLSRWERRLNISLFTPAEQKKYYVEFLVKALLRADSKTEAEVLQIERRNGIVSANDWLEITNRNPLPGTMGEKYIVESNMMNLEMLGEEAEDQAPAPTNGAGNGAGAGRKFLNGSAKHE